MTVVIEQDIIDVMAERKNNVAQMIADASKDPYISDSDMLKLFNVCSSAIDIYKYSWDNSFVREMLDEELETNSNDLKSFLLWLSYLDFKVYNLILERLI